MRTVIVVSVLFFLLLAQTLQKNISTPAPANQGSCTDQLKSLSLNFECACEILANILNLVLLPLTMILRIPQIMTIYKNKSVYGLSYFGNNLQFLMTSMSLAYGLHANFSFWIYGENIILSLQNLIVISMFFHYPQGNTVSDKKKYQQNLILPFIITFLVSSIFILQLVPKWCQQLSIWLQLLVFFGARGSQILNNYRYKTTQNLSVKTVLITLFCNIARTITVLVEAPASIGYILNYFIPIFVNGAIAWQIWFYKKGQEVNKKQ